MILRTVYSKCHLQNGWLETHWITVGSAKPHISSKHLLLAYSVADTKVDLCSIQKEPQQDPPPHLPSPLPQFPLVPGELQTPVGICQIFILPSSPHDQQSGFGAGFNSPSLQWVLWILAQSIHPKNPRHSETQSLSLPLTLS